MKYRVFLISDDHKTWYCGNSTSVKGKTGPFSEMMEDATLLTKKQAKDLIDSMRHRQFKVFADPSFTVVY